jgi:hypothetical protein
MPVGAEAVAAAAGVRLTVVERGMAQRASSRGQLLFDSGGSDATFRITLSGERAAARHTCLATCCACCWLGCTEVCVTRGVAIFAGMQKYLRNDSRCQLPCRACVSAWQACPSTLHSTTSATTSVGAFCWTQVGVDIFEYVTRCSLFTFMPPCYYKQAWQACVLAMTRYRYNTRIRFRTWSIAFKFLAPGAAVLTTPELQPALTAPERRWQLSSAPARLA